MANKSLAIPGGIRIDWDRLGLQDGVELMDTQPTQRKKLTLKANRRRSAVAPQQVQRAAPVQGRVRSGGSEYTFHAILAIIAALIFIALIAIQYWELRDYSKFPNVWPVVDEEMVIPITTPPSESSDSLFAE
jgi:hypothetical protein